MVETLFTYFAFSFAFCAVAFALAIRLEYLYGRLVGRPFFLHFYWRSEKLSSSDLSLLRKHSIYYRKWSARRRSYIGHRIAVFLTRHSIHGRSRFQMTREKELSDASVYVMMTFGLRNNLSP